MIKGYKITPKHSIIKMLREDLGDFQGRMLFNKDKDKRYYNLSIWGKSIKYVPKKSIIKV